MWASGDNYEEYHEQFPDAEEFQTYPGKYWGSVVPISALQASWGNKVSLPQIVRECNLLENGEEVEIDNNLVTVTYSNSMIYPNSYRLLAQWGKEECGKAVPAFADKCDSLVFVAIDNAHANYGKFYNTYAYIKHNGVNYITPVTNNMTMKEFLQILNG